MSSKLSIVIGGIVAVVFLAAVAGLTRALWMPYIQISEPTPTPIPAATSTPIASPSPTASTSAIPAASPTAKPTPKPTPKPSPTPSPTPEPTTFDLHIERIQFWGVSGGRGYSFDALGTNSLELKEASQFSTRFIVRNNGQVPATNVRVVWTVDGSENIQIKDRIDQGTSHEFDFGTIPSEGEHKAKLSVSVDMPESRYDNNSHEFTYFKK